jgi:predicted RNase H-like HicB family nuclease
MSLKYAVVFEKAAGNWAAYVPDLPGCVTTANTLSEAEANIREAIEGHLRTLEKRTSTGAYRKLRSHDDGLGRWVQDGLDSAETNRRIGGVQNVPAPADLDTSVESGKLCRMSLNQFVKGASFTATMFLSGFACHVPEAWRDSTKTVGPSLLVIKCLDDLRGYRVLLIGWKGLESAKGLFQ